MSSLSRNRPWSDTFQNKLDSVGNVSSKFVLKGDADAVAHNSSESWLVHKTNHTWSPLSANDRASACVYTRRCCYLPSDSVDYNVAISSVALPTFRPTESRLLHAARAASVMNETVSSLTQSTGPTGNYNPVSTRQSTCRTSRINFRY